METASLLEAVSQDVRRAFSDIGSAHLRMSGAFRCRQEKPSQAGQEPERGRGKGKAPALDFKISQVAKSGDMNYAAVPFSLSTPITTLLSSLPQLS